METKIKMGQFKTLEGAWNYIIKEFPFPNYIPLARKSSYFEMPNSVQRYLRQGSMILDFGAGPCDKTAMLALSGYQVTAFDDLQDDWHNFDGNKKKILDFANQTGIEYILPDSEMKFNFPRNNYDAIILNNVVEHLHDSPGRLLNKLIHSLKPGGYIFIAVPNAINLRKRIDILLGRTNYPPFENYYWSYPWRGHIREYVNDDLKKMGSFLGLEKKEISTHHYHLETITPLKRKIFKTICKIFPGLRESWLYVGQKPGGWQEREKPSESEFEVAFGKQYFDYKKEMFDK